jgi:hypothetical protein
MKKMSEKKSGLTKPTVLHIERVSETTATITECVSNSGYRYAAITLTREWAGQSSGKRVHTSNCFFETHEEDLVRLIRRSAGWVRENYGKRTATATDDHSGDTPREVPAGSTNH